MTATTQAPETVKLTAKERRQLNREVTAMKKKVTARSENKMGGEYKRSKMKFF